jgi:Na+/proline symporter
MVPNTEATLVTMITGLLPTGLKGLMAAALLAALMSTVSGGLNSIATLFSYDLYKRWRPDTSDKKLVLIGRIVTACGMVAAITWSPYIAKLGGVFKGISLMISFIAPPITALFMCGVFWRKASGRAALITAWFGTVMGFVCFVLAFLEVFKDWTGQIGFHLPLLMPGFYLFVSCVIVMILASCSHRATVLVSKIGTVFAVIGFVAIRFGALKWLATEVDGGLVYPFWLPWFLVPGFIYALGSPVLLVLSLLVREQPESPEKDDLVWKSPLEPLKGEAWRGIGNFRFLTVALIVTMVVFYWLFS